MLEHLAELRGEEAMLGEFPKEDLAKYLSPADLHVLEDPRESPSRCRLLVLITPQSFSVHIIT